MSKLYDITYTNISEDINQLGGSRRLTPEEKAYFIELGEIWWWESNRMLPINIFLRKEMSRFKHVQRTMNSKDVKVTHGPTVNLNKLTIKRVKRKSVQLLKKPKS